MHPIRRSIPIVFVAAVTLGSAAGCSSDSGSSASSDTTRAPSTSPVASGTTGSQLTETEFRTQANALCASEGQKVGQVVGPLFAGGQPTADQQQEALDQIVALSRDLSADLDALAEPDALTKDVDALITSLDAGTDAAAAQTGAEYFSSDEDPWSDASDKARAMGLDGCGPQSD